MWLSSFWLLRLSAMLWIMYAILSSTVFPGHFQLLHPTRRSHFVGSGKTAQISCTSTKNIEDGAIFFSWYKRGENRTPILIRSCGDKETGGRFACDIHSDRRRVILEIRNVKKTDSGLYFCAKEDQDGFCFSNGTSTLVVGDSYTPSTWVMLLQPSNQDPHSQFKTQLVCVVHGVSSFVQVSWDVPGGLQQEGQTILVKNCSGLLTFIRVLQLPKESQDTERSITCEVRFNSSGTSVKKTALLSAVSLTEGDGKCLIHKVSLAVVAGLGSLFVFLSFLWARFGFFRLGFHTKISKRPSSGTTEDGICYAQLDFQAKARDERPAAQRRKFKILRDL